MLRMFGKAWRVFVRLLCWLRDRVHSLGGWADVAKVFEAAAATVALGAGAWWFFAQRQSYPRADVSQVISLAPIQPDLFAVEADIAIKNEGKKLLRLHRARVMLQAISAAPYDYTTLSTLEGSAYWQASRPRSWEQNQFHDGELRWPVMKAFDGSVDHHIEPGETDNMILTFVVRCSQLNYGRTPVRLLRVATDIFKPSKEEGKEFAWKARAFVDVSKECSK